MRGGGYLVIHKILGNFPQNVRYYDVHTIIKKNKMHIKTTEGGTHQRGGGGLSREGGLINFFLLKGGLIREGGLFERGAY